MNVHVFLLTAATALFAAAWSSDRPATPSALTQGRFSDQRSLTSVPTPTSPQRGLQNTGVTARPAAASCLLPDCKPRTNRSVPSVGTADDICGWSFADCEPSPPPTRAGARLAGATANFGCYDLPVSGDLAEIGQEGLHHRRTQIAAAGTATGPAGSSARGYISIRPELTGPPADVIPMDSLWMFGGCDIAPPAGLTPGPYRLVSSAGDVRSVRFTADNLAYFDVVSDLFAREMYRAEVDGQRWYFIPIEPPRLAGAASRSRAERQAR